MQDSAQLAPVMESSSKHAPRSTHKAAKNIKAKDSEFMDGVYNSAAGTMPSEYKAWSPDGATGSAAADVTKPAAELDVSSSGSPTKRMMAMFGGSDAEEQLGTETAPKRSLPKPKSSAGLSMTVAKVARSKPRTSEQVSSGLATSTPVLDAPEKKVQNVDAAALSPEAPAQNVDIVAPAPEASALAAPADKKSVQLSFDSDEAIDRAFPAPDDASIPPAAPKHRRKTGHGSLVQTATNKPDTSAGAIAAAAAATALPQQYATWTPSDKAAVGPKKEGVLEQMAADFANDDDDNDNAPPKKVRSEGLTVSVKEPTTPKSNAAEASVTYDDDDLPRHHRSSLSSELQGGWRAFMKKGSAGKAKKLKLDPDVAIMESLYANDGALPSQYTAWQPPAGDAKPSSVVALMQVSSQVQEEANEVALSSTPAGRAAVLVMQQYGLALKSQTLQKLALAQDKLTAQKLRALWQRLQAVDPLAHAGAPSSAHGKQAQAEQWCLYFQSHEASAAPLRRAAARWEVASGALDEATSQRAALVEEVEARTQLKRTVEQDVQGLSAQLNASHRSWEASHLEQAAEKAISAADQGGAPEARGTLLELGAAAEGLHAARAELEDALGAALRQRSGQLEAQGRQLAVLATAARQGEAALVGRKAQASQARASLEGARKKLAGIEASCGVALGNLARRRHAGHMETRAIGMALKVLGGGE